MVVTTIGSGSVVTVDGGAVSVTVVGSGRFVTVVVGPGTTRVVSTTFVVGTGTGTGTGMGTGEGVGVATGVGTTSASRDSGIGIVMIPATTPTAIAGTAIAPISRSSCRRSAAVNTDQMTQPFAPVSGPTVTGLP